MDCSNVSLELGVIVRLYSERWKIEVFQKGLKSQTGMEKNRFKSIRNAPSVRCLGKPSEGVNQIDFS